LREALKSANERDAAQVQVLIGQTLEEKGDASAAVSEYLKVGYLHPSEKALAADADRKAATLLESLGRTDEAKKILDKINQ
jgi:TolA-binding protein